MTEVKRAESTVQQALATPEGRREMAAARAVGRVAQLLRIALVKSGLSQRAIANALGVTPGRVSQVLNGEGEIQVSTLARYLVEMGYELQIDARDRNGEAIGTPTRRRGRQTAHSSVFTGYIGGETRLPVIMFTEEDFDGTFDGTLSFQSRGRVPVDGLTLALGGLVGRTNEVDRHPTPVGYRRVSFEATAEETL